MVMFRYLNHAAGESIAPSPANNDPSVRRSRKLNPNIGAADHVCRETSGPGRARDAEARSLDGGVPCSQSQASTKWRPYTPLTSSTFGTVLIVLRRLCP